MLPTYTLKQLAYFVSTADTGTTSQAAAEHFVSQSALSAALTEFETSLGVKLLVRRKGRGVTLTEAGRDMLAQARELLASAEDFALTANETGSSVAGNLTIGCFEMLAPALLPKLMAGFSALWPEVTLDFIEGDQQSITDALNTGKVEVAIQFRNGLSLPDLVVHELSVPTPHVMLSVEHPLAQADSVRLEQLAEEPFVLMSTDAGKSFMMRSFELAGVTPNIRFRSGNFDHIRSLISHGLAYSLIVQRRMPQRQNFYSGISSVPVADPLPPDPILLVHRRGAQLTKRATTFWDYAISTAHRQTDSAAESLG